MAATQAQIDANQRNSRLSTGPRTEEGKARSRRNALIHGLTGDGVALPDEDVAEVTARFQELQEELQPSGISSRLHLRRFAYLSVRLERCERLDTAVYSKRVRHADEDFVDHRMTQVEDLAARLNYEPMTVARRLQNTPEGVDWLVKHWGELRADLMNRERKAWTQNHCSRVERLLGRPDENTRQPRAFALNEALSGFFDNINPSEIDGLNDHEKVEWARSELARIIDGELARLEGVRAALDPWKIEQDRVEAPDRCLFDLQPAMDRVRKYEAATERAMYKALKEFHALEETLKATRIVIEKDLPKEKLASFEPEGVDEQELAEVVAHSAPSTPPPSAQIPETIQFPAKRSLDDGPNFFGYQQNGVS